MKRGWRGSDSSPSSSSSSMPLPCCSSIPAAAAASAEDVDAVKGSSRSTPSSSGIPEELLVEILRRLPLQSLHRFKWVSKSTWYPLITEHVLPKLIPPPQPLGFFDDRCNFLSLLPLPHQPSLDHRLSFLPPSISSRGHGASFVDCCNGLLLSLVFGDPRMPSSSSYLVCNPATRSWTEIPPPGSFFPRDCLLDFDPLRASPHYRMVALYWRLWLTSPSTHTVVVCVYRSKTRSWGRERVVDYTGRFRYPATNRSQHRAVWDGAVHVLCCRRTCRDDWCIVTRFGLEEELPEYIDVPEGLQMEFPFDGACIGTLGDRLHLAYLDRDLLWIRVWCLLRRRRGEDSYNHEWVLVHKSTISDLSGRYKPGDQLHVVGFHPVTEAVFVLHDMVLFTYHLEKKTLEEHMRITSEHRCPSVFHFSPCSLDLLENRNQHQR